MHSTAGGGSEVFHFRRFSISQDRCAMKVGTDGVLLGAWASCPTGHKPHILDIGTGTGLVALLLAQRYPQARITAVEIDPAAARQADENQAASPFEVEVVQAAIQDFALEVVQRFDLIVSNPPFFSGGVLSELASRAAARHTTRLPHGDLLAAVRDLLAPKGRFAVILPLIEGMRLIELAEGYHLYVHRRVAIRPRAGKAVKRLLLEFGREQAAELAAGELIQYAGAEQRWTAEFADLVGDFYVRKQD